MTHPINAFVRRDLARWLLVALLVLGGQTAAKPQTAPPRSIPQLPTVFDLEGRRILQDEAHLGIVNGQLTAGINYRDVAGLSGLWSPPYVSSNFTLDGRVCGEKVPTSTWLWRPFQVERQGTVNQVAVSTVTTLIYGERAAVVRFNFKNTGDTSVPLELLTLAWLDTVRDWDFARPVSRTESLPHAEGRRLVLRQGKLAIVVALDSAAWQWETSGNLGRAFASLSPGQTQTLHVVIALGAEAEANASVSRLLVDPDGALTAASREYARRVDELFQKLPSLESDHPQLVRWYQRSLVHLLMNRWDLPDFVLKPYYSTGSVNGGCLANYLWNFGEPWEIFPLYDPAAARSHIKHFLSIDLLKHFNFLPITGAGSGPWYMINQEKIIGLIYYYVLLTGDTAFLDDTVHGQRIQEHLILQAMYGDDATQPIRLIDYGPSNSHLELRRAYAYHHVSPDLNARRYANYLRAATLCELAGQPAPYLRERAARLKPLLKERLWDPQARWFRFTDAQGQSDLRYTVQMFKAVGSGVFDPECETGLLSHLNEREFLSTYGLHSLSKRDPAFDQLDIDNGGGGICTCFPPQIVERLYQAGHPALAADLLGRLLWWADTMPYWGDSLVANAKDYRRDTPLQCAFDGATAAQSIIFGLFGVSPQPDGSVVFKPHPLPFANRMTLKGLILRGRSFEVRVEDNRFAVRLRDQTVQAPLGQTVVCSAPNNQLRAGDPPLSSDREAPKPTSPWPTTFAREAAPPASPLALWYRRPAARWLEALPVGNGRLGAMLFGGVTEERLALNESTFWSGRRNTEHENPEARKAFTQIRQLFQAGKYNEAAPLIGQLLGRRGNYGTSLPAGDLILGQDGTDGEIEEYRRELDLDAAVARVSFTARGVEYRRELIASHPAKVMALRLTASRPGAVSLKLRYEGWRFPWTAEVLGQDTLAVSGRALESMHSDGQCGVTFHARIRVLPEGGTVTAEQKTLVVSGADAVTILIAMHTDFAGEDPGTLCARHIATAQTNTWEQLRAAHVTDHQSLFRRVTLDLGGAAAARQPTDTRREALGKGQADPQLAALFFQYGRYLVIAGSRADSPLPMHLQGLWNDSLAATMGWTCDYHLDINTQQNYWPTEVANLSECGYPLFRLIESLQTPGRRTAQVVYGIDRGWVCHVVTNPWGFTAPGWGEGWGLHVVGGVWIATHLWEHYLFTGDREFLSQTAYPVLKGAAEFFLDYLYTEPVHSYLTTGPSVSPERGGEAAPGSVHDRALIYELFSAGIEASRTLGLDPGFRARLEAARAQLPPYKIGRNGQLQEWFHFDDGGETEHRHTSHLVGLFPLAQITRRGTPDLAAAADRSLQLRMGHPQWEEVEWSAGNAVCYHARLGQGEAALQDLHHLMARNADVNLLTFSRAGIAGAAQNIFVIDGNTSGAAGIAELLLQSHAGEIELLPALPKAWPHGSARGLRARGNFTVDLEWRDGRITHYRIASREPRPVQVRIHGETRIITAESEANPTAAARYRPPALPNTRP